jgi:hypothetical protein
MPFFPQFSNLFVPPFIRPKLVDGLLAYWKMDTNSWIDSTGNGNSLTQQGSVVNTGGLIGNCAAGFSGSNYLITPSGFAPLSGQKTYSCWVYFNVNDIGYQFILGQGGTADYQSTFPFIIEIDNVITTYFTTEYGTWTNSIGSGITPNIESWYHLALTFNGSIGELYVNATSVGSSAYSGSIDAPDIDRFLFGRYYDDENSYPLDGLIDEVGVWNRALTGAEITTLYNNDSGITYPFN